MKIAIVICIAIALGLPPSRVSKLADFLIYQFKEILISVSYIIS